MACFAGWTTLTFNFYCSLYCVRKNEFIFYFPTIYKANRNYTSMLGKSTNLAVIPAAKHPKHSKFAITDIREKPVKFFYCPTRASTLVSAIILLTQVLLQKFPFLFIIIIPCIKDIRALRPRTNYSSAYTYRAVQFSRTIYTLYYLELCSSLELYIYICIL